MTRIKIDNPNEDIWMTRVQDWRPGAQDWKPGPASKVNPEWLAIPALEPLSEFCGLCNWTLQPGLKHEPSTDILPTLGNRIIDDEVKWGNDIDFRGEFIYTPGYWEWAEDVLNLFRKPLREGMIYDVVFASLFTYDLNVDIVQAFCEAWCPRTNTLITSFGEMSISLRDLYMLGGLPLLGDIYDERIPNALDLNKGSYTCCAHLFEAFFHPDGSTSGAGKPEDIQLLHLEKRIRNLDQRLLTTQAGSLKLLLDGRTNPKRNRGESSRQPQAQHHAPQYEIFNTPGAHERYQACISKRTIKAERGIEIITPDAWNWGTSFLAQPSDAFDSIVREFYANAKDGVETHQCIVRGVAVNFSPAAINAYYGTTNHGGYDHYHRVLRPGNITQADLDNIAHSFHHDAGWNIRSGVAAHMDYRFFFPLDRAIIDFIRAKLIPNSHRGNVKRELVFLTYCIKEQQTIDIGRLISRSISEIAQAEVKTRCFLGHASLITELCKRVGVPIIENQDVLLPPQLYLSQHHIQTRYGQGHVPVPDPEDAENEDQANDEAMEDPAPAAHAPDHFPPQYNMEQYFARQEEFMRRQEEFMTRHEGYMRRSDDINWFVGTSAHQHNLAAQGLTPQFPPPPPWLQDPQFIPPYYSVQFPPPPRPEGDHP
nr:Cytochrome P450 71A6 [Ipomoea batatas]